MSKKQIYSEKSVKIYLQILHDINLKCKDNFTIKLYNLKINKLKK